MEYNSIDYTIAYFPLILLSVSKIASKINLKWFLILSASLFLQIISGYPQNVIYTLVISLIYFFYLIKKEEERYKKTVLLLSSFLFGFLLSSVQLIPSFELYNLSIRNLDKVALAGNVKYLPFVNLITVFFPDYFGNPGRWNYFGIGTYDNFAFTISSVGIYFAVIFLFINKEIKKKYYFFLILLISVVVFSIKNPLSEAISNIKYLGFISGSNTRILFVASFILSIMAAVGFEEVLRKKVKKMILIIPLFIFSAILFIHLIYLYVLSGNNFIQVFYLITNKILSSDTDVKNLVVSTRNMLLPTIVAISLSAVLFIDNYKNKKLTITITILFLFVSILNSTDKYLSFVKRDILYPNTEVTDFLKGNLGYFRFEKENNNLIFPSNSWSLYNIMASTGQDALTPLSISRYLSLINYGKINDDIATRYNSIINLYSPLINTLNIKYFVMINWLNDSPDITGNTKTWLLPNYFKEVNNIKTVRIYENEDNLGLAWFSDSIECDKNDNDIYKKIVLNNYNPKELLYIDCEGRLPDKSGSDMAVNVISIQANKMQFYVDTTSGNYLAISSAYYPGWYAYVDGVKEKVNKADTALIAVKVPEGKHYIELKYQPLSFRWGIIISVLSFIAWLMLLFVSTGLKKKN